MSFHTKLLTSNDVSSKNIVLFLPPELTSPYRIRKVVLTFCLYSDSVRENFSTWSTRALQKLKNYFQMRGRDFDLIVDSEKIKEAHILQIAVLCGLDNLSDEMLSRLQKELNEELRILDSLDIWIDDDEDSVKEDEEVQPAEEPGIRRAL